MGEGVSVSCRCSAGAQGQKQVLVNLKLLTVERGLPQLPALCVSQLGSWGRPGERDPPYWVS